MSSPSVLNESTVPASGSVASGDEIAGPRVGIVGGGFMARVHAHAVRASGGTVVAVASSSPERSRTAAAELGASRAARDVDDLVGMDDVDVVHVCTPNHLHHSLAMTALSAGTHVVCEKPLATDAELARELAECAREQGVVATVPFVYRFHAMVREARERVRSGSIGTVTLVHGSYLQDWLSDPTQDNWRVDAERGGASRAFADIGSHWCDLMEFVSGDRIEAVQAQFSTVSDHRGGRKVTTEDAAVVTFRTRAGVVGTTVISQVSPGRKNRLLLEVSGSDGSLVFDQEQPERLWEGRRDASRLLLRDPDTLSEVAARYATVPAGHPQGYQDAFNAFVGDTAAAIRGESPDGLPTFDDGLRSARIVDAVVASSRSGDWIEVPA